VPPAVLMGDGWLLISKSKSTRRTAAGLISSSTDRNWDLIVHDPAHRGTNGAAMPTDRDDQGGHFFFKLQLFGSSR